MECQVQHLKRISKCGSQHELQDSKASYGFSTSLKAFCLCRLFHWSVLEMLVTQSSLLLLPGGITYANGYLDAEMVT